MRRARSSQTRDAAMPTAHRPSNITDARFASSPPANWSTPLNKKTAKEKAGQIAEGLTTLDLVILHELGYMPLSASCGALLLRLLSKLYERSNVVVITNLSLSRWAMVFGDVKMAICLSDRLTHRHHILETGNDSFRVKTIQPLQPAKKDGKRHASGPSMRQNSY